MDIRRIEKEMNEKAVISYEAENGNVTIHMEGSPTNLMLGSERIMANLVQKLFPNDKISQLRTINFMAHTATIMVQDDVKL